MDETTTETAAQRMRPKALAWEVTVPAGTYVLADPCYSVPKEHWTALLDSCGYFDASPVGEVAGYQVTAFNAPDVPGRFTDQDGTEYLCDSGLFGLVPVELAENADYDSDELRELGRVVTFDHPVRCTSENRRMLVFGNVIVDTDPEEER